MVAKKLEVVAIVEDVRFHNAKCIMADDKVEGCDVDSLGVF